MCNRIGFQLTGGPGWLDTDMYDIVATTGRPEKITPEESRLLLRNLLAHRFALHREECHSRMGAGSE
jgi:uncharacterized protein (TIGR03435 family)